MDLFFYYCNFILQSANKIISCLIAVLFAFSVFSISAFAGYHPGYSTYDFQVSESHGLLYNNYEVKIEATNIHRTGDYTLYIQLVLEYSDGSISISHTSNSASITSSDGSGRVAATLSASLDSTKTFVAAYADTFVYINNNEAWVGGF